MGSRDTNVVILIGRAVADCESSYTGSGLAIGKFSIACNDIKKGTTGYTDEVSFFSCVMFGKIAENVGKYITKGKQVSIVGKLKQDKWVDNQTGQNRYAVKVIINQLQLLGGGQQGQTVQAPQELFNKDDITDAKFEEDIPF